MADKVVIRLEIDGSGNARVLKDHEDGITGLGKAAKGAGGGLSEMALGVLAAQAAVGKLHEISDKAGRVLDDLVSRGSSMDSLMLKIGARSSEGAAGVKGLREELSRMSVQFGKRSVELGQTALSIVSEGATSAAKALRILNPSIQLAAATNSDLATSAFVVQRGMQAFGIGVSKAADFANDLFIAADQGRDSLEELGNATIVNAGKARQLGVSHRELLATEVALQKEGRNLGDITSGLGSILGGLLRPNEDLIKSLKRLGVTSGDELITKFHGLGGALEAIRTDMEKHSEGFVKAFRGADTYSIALDTVNRVAHQTPGLMQAMATNTGALTDRISAQSGSLESLRAKWDAIQEAISQQTFFSAIEQFKDMSKATNDLGESVLEFTKQHPALTAIGVGFLQVTQKTTSLTASVLDFIVQAAALRIMLPALGIELAAVALAAKGGVVAIVALAAAYGGWKLAEWLDNATKHTDENAEAFKRFRAEGEAAGRAARQLAAGPPVLLSVDMHEQITDITAKIRTAFEGVQAALVAGNKIAARSMMDDLLQQYGAEMARIPKGVVKVGPGGVMSGHPAIDPIAGDAQDLATRITGVNSTLPAAVPPPGDAKKWSDVLGEIRDKYQGFVDAEKALTEASNAHIKALAATKAPAQEIGTAVQETLVHQKATLEATIRMNEALIATAGSAKAPTAEITKFQAEIDIARQQLGDIGTLLGDTVQSAIDEVVKAEQAHLDTLDAILAAKRQTYDLAVAMARPEAEILEDARAVQEATNASSKAAAELAARVVDVAKNSGASADQMAKFGAQLDLAKGKAGDMNSVMMDAHRTIKGMYENIKIDLPSAFRQGMRDSFAAVVSGTRKMSDVWEGVNQSITGQFADAFGAIIFGKKKQFDDPMEKNLGGIADLFGATANDAQGHFGGLFQWISNGFSKVFGLASKSPSLTADAVRTGSGGVLSSSSLNTSSGGGLNLNSLFGGVGSWFKNLFGGSGSASSGGGLFDGIGNWVKGLFGSGSAYNASGSGGGFSMSGIGSWFKGLFGGGSGSNNLGNLGINFAGMTGTGNYGLTGGAGLSSPSVLNGSIGAGGIGASASSGMSFSSFSSGYGAILGMLGAAMSNLDGFYESKTEAAFVKYASMIPVYGYMAYALPILDRMGRDTTGLLGVHNQDAWAAIFNPAETLYRNRKTERDYFKGGSSVILGDVIKAANREYFSTKNSNTIVPRGEGLSMVQRSVAGLDTGTIARVLALMMIGGGGKKPAFKSHDEDNPNINNAGWLGQYQTSAGQIQATFDKFPEMAEKFAKDLAQGLSGGIATAVNAVQNGILRVVNQTRRPDENQLYAYERLIGMHPEDPFRIGGQGKTDSKSGNVIGGKLMPTMEEAVKEIMVLLVEDMPRAIKNHAQEIVDREFERERLHPSPDRNYKSPGGPLTVVKGSQIARAFEIEENAFKMMSAAFTDAGGEIIKGATRKEGMDIFRAKLREAVTKAFAEGISSSFVHNVIEDNLLGPVMFKLDRGLELASKAKSPGEAMDIFDKLTVALGSDLQDMEKKVAAMGPLLEKYAKLQERIALAAISFDDVAKAAKELGRSLRGSIAQFTEDLETQQRLATMETKKVETRTVSKLERTLGIDKLADFSKDIIESLSDNDLKRMPEMIERARAAIVANAELELQYLRARLQVAQQWASLKMPADESMRQVREFGRQNTKPALSQFEAANRQMRQFLKDFHSDDEATRLSAAGNIVQGAPGLLELARQAGYAPGSQIFDDLRATLEGTLAQITKEASAREVEAMQLQRDIKEVQDKTLAQLTTLADIAKGVEAEARVRQIKLLEDATNWDELQFGALNTQTDALRGIYGLLDRGINVSDNAKYDPTPLPGLSAGGLVTGSTRAFTLHPPELVIPLDRIDEVLGRGGRASSRRDLSVVIQQAIHPPSDGSRARSMSAEEEALLQMQLRRMMRDPIFVAEVERLARKAQQES